jgi:hypothetical protein
MSERPLRDLPRWALPLLVLLLAAQVALHRATLPPAPTGADLPAPPRHEVLAVMSLAEHTAMARLLVLRLQSFTTVPGKVTPLASLNYDVVAAWLDAALRLDPWTQYPLLLAARVYGAVSQADKARQMFEYVAERFQHDPDRRWPWLAHAALMAKTQLKDLPLARSYARLLRERATGAQVPDWARQMEVFILEQMGDVESAARLLKALIDGGQVRDPNELRFLLQRLEELRAQTDVSRK